MSKLLAKDDKESLNLKKCPKELKRTKLYAQLWHNLYLTVKSFLLKKGGL